MSSDDVKPQPLSLEAIETLVCQAEPRVLFVEPRILRRVIVQDRRIPGLGLQVPHSKVFTIERERLLVFADRPELGLTPAAELPLRVILIGRPTDDEDFARLTTEERLHLFWRLAFHGRVHAEIEQQIDDQQLTSRMIAEHLKRIGAGEFAEIRQVLSKDDLLLPPQDDEAAFVEFVAVALELKYFAPGTWSCSFRRSGTGMLSIRCGISWTMSSGTKRQGRKEPPNAWLSPSRKSRSPHPVGVGTESQPSPPQLMRIGCCPEPSSRQLSAIR